MRCEPVPDQPWQKGFARDVARLEALGLDEARRRTWLKHLADAWQQINWAWRLELSRPNFTLLGSGRRWGSWDPVGRTIGISERQIGCYRWESVLETLKHEIAHQYVDEVLDGQDTGPHGEAFRGLCHRLGISPRARWDGGATLGPRPEAAASPEPDPRLRRIRKLLALADDRRGNQNEARAALARARRLLLEYNVELSTVQEDGVEYASRSLGLAQRRTHAFKRRLGAILSDFFFVDGIWIPVYDAEMNHTGKVLEVAGTSFNVDMAEYVWEFLCAEGDRLWRRYRKENGPQGPGGRLQFLDGLMSGFRSHLEAEAKVSGPGEALVWLGDPGLDEFMRRRHPRVRRVRWQAGARSNARQAGVSEGRALRLRRPIETTTEQRGRALPRQRD